MPKRCKSVLQLVFVHSHQVSDVNFGWEKLGINVASSSSIGLLLTESSEYAIRPITHNQLYAVNQVSI